jgi:hypothetical protein
MTIIISQRRREAGMVTWNTSDIEHVTRTERWPEDAAAASIDPALFG